MNASTERGGARIRVAWAAGAALWVFSVGPATEVCAQATNENYRVINVTDAVYDGYQVATTNFGSLVVTGAWLNGTALSNATGDVFVRPGLIGSGSGTYRRLFSFSENKGPYTDDLTAMQNGYNRNGAFDASVSPGFATTLTVGQMLSNYVTPDGYFLLAFDVNETGGNAELSFDDLQIWTSTNQNPTIPTTPAGLTNLGTPRYKLNAGNTQTFLLMDGVGSGEGNIYFFVQKSLLV